MYLITPSAVRKWFLPRFVIIDRTNIHLVTSSRVYTVEKLILLIRDLYTASSFLEAFASLSINRLTNSDIGISLRVRRSGISFFVDREIANFEAIFSIN